MKPNIVGNQKLTEYLERLYGTKLPENEALEYKNRLVKFFNLLIEIDQKQRKGVLRNENK